MTCNSMTIPSSSTSTIWNDVFKQQNGLARSETCKDLRRQGILRRSFSENHICCTTNTRMQPKLKNSRSFGIFPFQISSSIIPRPLEIVPHTLRTFLFDPETSKGMVLMEKSANASETLGEEDEEKEVKRANWVDRLLEIRSHWMSRQQKEDADGDDELCGVEENGECRCDNELDGCTVDYNEELKGEETKYDRKTFSSFLANVPWSDTKLFSKLAFLCNMAYVIPEIKVNDLRRRYGLQFVTSSLEKKAEAAEIKEKLDQDSMHSTAVSLTKSSPEETEETKQRHAIRSSVYEIAASAASYVQSRAKGYSSCLQEAGDSSDTYRYGAPSDEEGESSPQIYKSEVAAVVAASTMTAVVAAGEKEKQEAAAALQSLHSSPCEWFICDDISTYTRCFVIQGSDSLASWQTNLFFEPAKFEETDVLVHRGIYEAAKGIYKQFMPEIIEHLNRHGERAKLQFTGHSLGGSLALLVNLMLLKKKVVKPSTLRPVITFGSPFVFCGGQRILTDLGLDDNHVHSVMMHRDIVPRAFSCNYPNHVAQVLKRLNGSFRSHPCLIQNKLLYSPLGKLFILQPDEKSSPPHPFLPPGAALYELDNNRHGYSASVLEAFLNSPHPLETLSDPTAYGSEGTIVRDHDSSNYLKAVNTVLRKNTKKAPLLLLKSTTESNLQWPLLASPSPHSWSNETDFDGSVFAAKEAITV